MKIKLILFLLAITSSLFAQTPKEPKTLFGNGKPHLGYFIVPSCQFGPIAGPIAVLPGIGAGITMNNKISVGLSFKFIATENTPNGEDDQLYLDQKYAGIKGEYYFFEEKTVHVNIQIEAGVGHTELDLKDSFEYETVPVTDATFAYSEPGAAVEINLWKYLKLDLGASYRLVSNVTIRNLTEKDFRGFNYSAGLKIGIF